MASDMTVAHHTFEGFLKFVLPEDTVTVDMEVMTLKGIHIFRQDNNSNEKTFIPWSEHNKPPSSLLKRLRETQDTPSKEFLESMLDRNVEANFRPKTTYKCPKIARMSDSELIQDVKLRKIRQMDNTTETQVRPPKPSRRTPIPSDWSDDDGKDDQTRAFIAKPVPQDPQPSTSFGTYASETLRRPSSYLKVLTFGRGKLAPLASGTGITLGCRHAIHIDQTPPVREPTVTVVPPSPDKVVYNDSVQMYGELPVPVRPRHALANWTSIRLGNNPNRPTMNEREDGQLIYNSVLDSTRLQNREYVQQDRESDDAQSTDPDLMYSDYSSEHLDDLE